MSGPPCPRSPSPSSDAVAWRPCRVFSRYNCQRQQMRSEGLNGPHLEVASAKSKETWAPILSAQPHGPHQVLPFLEPQASHLLSQNSGIDFRLWLWRLNVINHIKWLALDKWHSAMSVGWIINTQNGGFRHRRVLYHLSTFVSAAPFLFFVFFHFTFYISQGEVCTYLYFMLD